MITLNGSVRRKERDLGGCEFPVVKGSVVMVVQPRFKPQPCQFQPGQLGQVT